MSKVTAMGGTEKRTRDCAWCGTSLDDGERLSGRTRCAACGVATTDPWPSAADLDQAYGGWYRPSTGRFAGAGDAVLRFLRASAARRIDRIAPPGPALDVGAGDGAMLDALRARGRGVAGLERSNLRPDIREGDLRSEPEGSWAAIIFWHSLEHLPEPASALEKATNLLAPGGILVIAAPNSASLQASAFGDRWLALDLPRHLVHVSDKDLLGRLQALGLKAERVSYLRGGQVLFGWLHGMVAVLPGHLSLYDAIRRPPARSREMGRAARIGALAAAAALFPVAILATATEAVTRRGGTVYVEARVPRDGSRESSTQGDRRVARDECGEDT